MKIKAVSAVRYQSLEEDINFRKLKEEINLLRSHNEEKHED